jgi:hypothetical protein
MTISTSEGWVSVSALAEHIAAVHVENVEGAEAHSLRDFRVSVG